MSINEHRDATVANLRRAAAHLNQYADFLAKLDFVKELIVNAPQLFRKLLDDDKALRADAAAKQAEIDALKADEIPAADLIEADSLLNPPAPAPVETPAMPA